eukprot:CAMPEP_0114255242 /NCGR_PEP_ID=MMETSP0058-20121206/17443_1 /TAXON_ID=36894 /ORGANISM="Pyramimonas parkeae, CCMP726" /LENGTH=456 /DNA_ID=CAMNT_0001369585 /DNA_START=375 /DNA_END=1745 /DNA_ORIENTATION=+
MLLTPVTVEASLRLRQSSHSTAATRSWSTPSVSLPALRVVPSQRARSRRGVVRVAAWGFWLGGRRGQDAVDDDDGSPHTHNVHSVEDIRTQLTAMDRGHAMRSEPLLPLSYQGALLTSCLKATPELFDAAVNKQLEQLIYEREKDQVAVPVNGPGVGARQERAWAKQEVLLKKRIVEVRQLDRTRALEDVLYTTVLAKHMDFNVTPTTGCTRGDVEWLHSPASKEHLQALLDMQPPQAIPLITEHVRAATAGLPEFHQHKPTLLPKLGVAQVFRRGILFGYVLQQVIERHNLEASIPADENLAAGSLVSLSEYSQNLLSSRKATTGNYAWDAESEQLQQENSGDVSSRFPDTPSLEEGACFSTLEAMRVAERHATAVFGSILDMANGLRDVIVGADSLDEAQARMEFAMEDGQLETVSLTLAAVCHLVMEGVAFGRQLREAERGVDLSYGLEPLDM